MLWIFLTYLGQNFEFELNYLPQIKTYLIFFSHLLLHFYVKCYVWEREFQHWCYLQENLCNCEFWKTFGMFKVLISVLKERSSSILNGPDPFEKESRRRHLLHKLPQKMRKSSYPHGAMLYWLWRQKFDYRSDFSMLFWAILKNIFLPHFWLLKTSKITSFSNIYI